MKFDSAAIQSWRRTVQRWANGKAAAPGKREGVVSGCGFLFLVHEETRRAPIHANAERTNTAMTTHSPKAPRRALSRRAFLKTTAGTAALLGALRTNFPFGVHVAEAAGPEVTKANLGFSAPN